MMDLDNINNKLVVLDIGEVLCLINAGVHAGINNSDLISAKDILEAISLKDKALKKAVMLMLCDHGLCVLNPIETISNKLDSEVHTLLNQNYWLEFNNIVNVMLYSNCQYLIDVKCSGSSLLIFLDEIPKGEINGYST